MITFLALTAFGTAATIVGVLALSIYFVGREYK